MIAPETVILKVLAKAQTSKQKVLKTKLVKLVYLVDYLYFQSYGETATGFHYQWDHHGPNAIGNAIVDTANGLARKHKIRSLIGENPQGLETITYVIEPSVGVPEAPATLEVIVDDVMRKYGHMTVAQVTKASKETAPFKTARQYQVLVMEKNSPAVLSTAADAEAYLKDLAKSGTTSLEDIKKLYHVA